MEEEKTENEEEAAEDKKNKEPKKAVPRLLLVDSDKKSQELVPKAVAAVGMVVDTVETQEEALNLLQKRGPYAILLSGADNGGKSVDIFQKARKLAPHTTRILTAGKLDEKTLMEFVNSGEPYRVLIKPFDNKLLLKVVQEGLRQFEMSAASAARLKLMGKLEEEFKKARGQVYELKEQVSKLKTRLQMILGGMVLLVITYSVFYGIQVYQEAKLLEDKSIQLGAWILYNNKTAKDTTTGKTWMSVDFRNIEKRAPKSWDEAVEWRDKINEKKFGGFDDWRLPTLQEYKNTYDQNHTKTAYENRDDYKVGYPVAFEDGGGYGYWSSDSTSQDNAGYFFFIGGYDKYVARDYSSPSMSVRLVRGG